MSHSGTLVQAAKNRLRRGNAIIEFALLAPWYVFLFVGVYDMGFYAYSLNGTQSAARAMADYCSNSYQYCSAHGLCDYASKQLSNMPNTGSVDCTASPLTVTVTYPTGPDGSTFCTDVVVSYVTPQLIPIPGLFPGQLTISKEVKMADRD